MSAPRGRSRLARRMNADQVSVLRARLVWFEETLEDGDFETARAVLADLIAELGVERGTARCRGCSFRGWAGLVQAHEYQWHPAELCDLEERRRAA